MDFTGPVIAFFFIIIVVRLLLKKYNPHAVLLFSGLIMMVISWLLGYEINSLLNLEGLERKMKIGFKSTSGESSSINNFLDFIKYIVFLFQVKHAKVSRLSDLPRNPNNFASEPFLSQISTYKTQLLNGDKLNGNSILHEGKEYRCYPIVTNGMCLQCHGKKGTDIAPETLKVLNEKYPNDLATGYSANQLRGIWVVEMN